MRNCKTILLLIIFIFSTIAISSCKRSEKSRAKILKIYNWADYIDEEVLAEFPAWYKQQTGEEVKVVYQVFDMVEVMYTKVVLGHEDFDLVCPTQAIIERMLKQRLLLPMQLADSSNNFIGNISPFITRQVALFSIDSLDANQYVVPYMWGTSGILYNKQWVDSATVSSWGAFWNPAHKGKVLMKDSYSDAYGTALLYAYRDSLAHGSLSGYQATNAHTPADFLLAEQQLKELRKNVAGWEADFGKEMMTKGKIWMTYAWSGDAVWAIDEAAEIGVELDYIVPREGSNIWFDGWVIPKYAQNIKAASYFVSYLCQPEIALRNMDEIGYTSAVALPEMLEELVDTAAYAPVDLSYLLGNDAEPMCLNPIQYPDASVVERCSLLHDFLDRNDAALEMWSRAKGDSLNAGMAIAIFAFFGMLAFWLIYRKTSRWLTQKRR